MMGGILGVVDVICFKNLFVWNYEKRGKWSDNCGGGDGTQATIKYSHELIRLFCYQNKEFY